ncbi:MAG: hypothetical protein VX916_05230 [Planctomycetota bacterium]|nr:hypothetical protein [Planctomycetota bacterium]
MILFQKPIFRFALRTYFWNGEGLCLGILVLAMELLGPRTAGDVHDIPWVLSMALLAMFGISLIQYRSMPLSQSIMRRGLGALAALRSRLVLNLGLDFHPSQTPAPPPFAALRRGILRLVLVVLAVLPVPGVLRGLVEVTVVPGLYTIHVLLLGLVWAVLLAGIAVAIPISILIILEITRSRFRMEGALRLMTSLCSLGAVGGLLWLLNSSVGMTGCLGALVFACLLPSVVRTVEPSRAPWLNLSLGSSGRVKTTSLSDQIRDGTRLIALESVVILCLLLPGGGGSGNLAVTDFLLAVYGWSTAWMLIGGFMIFVGEFNRRRRLFDPAFSRSRVLWAVPGDEAESLETERQAIEEAGWRLVVSERLPHSEDADLLVGLPPGLVLPGNVPLARVPPALFLLSKEPGVALQQADEEDKAARCRAGLEQMLASGRPHSSERNEGTFLVPHCWLVVGLTRDNDRRGGERPAPPTIGLTYQAVLGTRLRRFFSEVMSRADVDVLYVEDAVTSLQVGEVLQILFDRHIARETPEAIGEHDFMGLQGVRVVIHNVDPEEGGIEGVDAHLTRHAISRARILIISKDRNDGDDGDGPSSEGESSDLWLKDALRDLFPSSLVK